MLDTFEKDITAIANIDAVQKILEVICRTTGMGFSAVARVTDTHWIACAVRDEINFGLVPGGELKLETTICDEIRQSGKLVVIDHVANDPEFCAHHTPRMYGFQSYLSVPITRADGAFFGTLCAIDPRPAKLNTPEVIGMFKLFADLIAMHLDAQDRVTASEAALLSERQAAQLREQFIAVLGHDLRNPLSAIMSATELLRFSTQDEEGREVLDLIQRSTGRMAGLINNLLDFARGRLGGGISISLTVDAGLENAIRQVVTELQTTWPKRGIVVDLRIDKFFSCDSARIGQLLSNLIANAITHGDTTSPIWVYAATGANEFELSVTNHGETIPPQIIDRLFEPFARGAVKPGQQGLGLGLYIATEIARAHAGVLNVSSKDGETVFVFRMPTK